MKSHDDRTLFDDLERGVPCPTASVTPAHLPRSERVEVPLDVFLAMPQRQQLEYCAQRDEDSALYEEDAEKKYLFLDRAAWYRAEMERV